MDNFIYLKDFYDRNFSTFTTRINPESFIPQLISICVLSESDQDEICNHYVYTTKVQRAGVFINILKTKGELGFRKFKELLGWEYPHVFEEVFQDEKPSPTPKGYPVNDNSRKSCDLHDLMKYGFNQRHILGEYKVVSQKLVDLQELLQFTQLEKKDLEMEIQRLRELEVLSRQQQEKLKEFEKDNKHIKEENREFMRKNIHLRDENDHQTNRIQTLLYERDEIERQLDSKSVDLDRLNECQSELQENFEKERRISQKLHRQCNDLKTARVRPLNMVQNLIDRNSDSNRLLQTRIEILETDLEQERESNHTLLEDLDITREQNYQQRNTINELQSNISALRKESEKSALWLKKAELKTEEYYKTIQQLQREKRKVEEEKIVSQQMNWDLGEQKNFLFQRKHELERQLEICHREHDKLKTDMLRERLNTKKPINISKFDDSGNLQSADALCGVSQTDSVVISGSYKDHSSMIVSEPVVGRCRKNRDSLIVNIGSQKQVYPVEKEIEDDEDIYINIGILEPQCTESGPAESLQIDSILSQESPSQYLYKKDYLVLLNVGTLSSAELCFDKDRSEIVVNKLYIQDANLQTGDVIVQLHYQSDGVDVVVSFDDITLDEAQKAVEKCLKANPDIIPVYIRPGATTRREILDNSQCYIRYNLTDMEPVIDEQTCLRVNEGEIIFVDVKFENKVWKAQKLDQKTGRKLRADGVIPNVEEAKKLFSTCKVELTSPYSPNSPNSSTGLFCRKPVIKRSKVDKPEQCSPYIVVLPMKAWTSLPVLIRGTETVVTAVLDLLKTTDTSWAKVINDGRRVG